MLVKVVTFPLSELGERVFGYDDEVTVHETCRGLVGGAQQAMISFQISTRIRNARSMDTVPVVIAIRRPICFLARRRPWVAGPTLLASGRGRTLSTILRAPSSSADPPQIIFFLPHANVEKIEESPRCHILILPSAHPPSQLGPCLLWSFLFDSCIRHLMCLYPLRLRTVWRLLGNYCTLQTHSHFPVWVDKLGHWREICATKPTVHAPPETPPTTTPALVLLSPPQVRRPRSSYSLPYLMPLLEPNHMDVRSLRHPGSCPLARLANTSPSLHTPDISPPLVMQLATGYPACIHH